MTKSNPMFVLILSTGTLSLVTGCSATRTAQQAAGTIAAAPPVSRAGLTTGRLSPATWPQIQEITRTAVGQLPSVQLPGVCPTSRQSNVSVSGTDSGWIVGESSAASSPSGSPAGSTGELQTSASPRSGIPPSLLPPAIPGDSNTASSITAGGGDPALTAGGSSGDLTAAAVNAGGSTDLPGTSFTGAGSSGSW
jgi:hypothetical protein